MAYATIAQLNTYLGLSTGHADTTLCTDLLARAQAIIEKWTGRLFEYGAASDETFDSYEDVDGAELWFPSGLEACEVTAIVNGDGTTVTADEYVLLPRSAPYYGIKLLGSSGVSWEEDSTTGDTEDAITVTGKWAYSATAPADIVHATIRLAAFLYRQKESGADIDRALRNPDGSVLMPAKLPADVEAILQQYKRVVLA